MNGYDLPITLPHPISSLQQCLAADQLKTATSYLLILHTLEPLQTTSQDTVRLLEMTLQAEDFEVLLAGICSVLAHFPLDSSCTMGC
jgi:hypothetical protein